MTRSSTPRSKKPTDPELVASYMDRLDHSLKPEVESLRKIIKGADPRISERIKWNAPSYYYQEDILTFGPMKKDAILLVIHHPGVVKVKSTLLEGNFKDRRLLWFKNRKEINENKNELQRIIREIIAQIEKTMGK